MSPGLINSCQKTVSPSFSRFYWKCFRIGGDILQALAIRLGLGENRLPETHPGHNNQLRLLHYPSKPGEAIDAGRAAMCWRCS
ncbi:uncharacterized protein N7515_003495 [Penicillium bovifimosum]|uniref:Uncharacterized protein n=1 Tax=Penicillium bovifimosum TaxID=126998 RepID=A0A9W9H4R1_9EURO|nr:uncharacterized protein N7515_003495 [Penicillium bovifimosum]KAJ5138647.1 hypothetical protein N7515_003495 [Penicillium bovifimosum]